MGQQFSVTLPDDLAEMVRARVRSGEYASVDEVIGDALARTGDEDSHADPEVERWLRTEVLETLRALDADPSLVLTPEEVATSIEEDYRKIVASRNA